MTQTKEPVRLRQKPVSGGRISLYLDIYINKKRSYEFLKLYLIPEKTKEDRAKNRETMLLAESIRAKRLVEVRNHTYGFLDDFAIDTNFLDFYRSLCEERFKGKEKNGNWGNWWSALQHLERYTSPHTTFRDITPEWCQGFRRYLDHAMCRDKRHDGSSTPYEPKPLAQNSKTSYFNKVRCCINTAFERRIIPRNPMQGIPGFKDEEVHREYLTLDELKAMAATHCRMPGLKKAFLFSCLTGIRKSDIEKLRWKEVVQQGEFTRLIFRQKKTGGQEYLDINPQAAEYMGSRRRPEDLVFPGFRYSSEMLLELKRWAMEAGILKNITFHSGRHTFAVLMIDLGADIYTVQKLLGHRELRTTQIYAKMLDKNKQNAVMMIPDIEEKDE